MRPISFLVVALATTVAWAADIPVSSQSELAAAIASAAAGDTIVLADGNYDSTGLACNASGTAAMPISVKAAHPLKAIVRFTEPGGATEGFKVAGDY